MLQYKFIEKLKQLPYVKKIILFGSRARKDNIERADIDLAILCPKANDKDWLDIVDIIENADTLLHIDCLRFDQLSEKSKIKKNILDEGVSLYEQSTH